MTEKKYLKALKRELRGLSGEDRLSILDDCHEHFLRGRESGKGEEGIIAALGSPVELAESARSELGVEKFRESPAGNVVRISMSGFSLLLFNAIVVVGPYAGFVGALAGLWASAVSVVLSGVAMILVVPAEPLLRIWLDFDRISGLMPRVAVFFAGISLVCLGALICLGLCWLTLWFVKGTVAYARLTWRIVVR